MEHKTSKKVTRVEGGETTSTKKTFVPSDDSKARARNYRLIAVLAWIIAIGVEIFAILQLKKVPVNTTLLIILIGVDLAFAVTGSLLWKKSNRLSPASEKEPVRFFIQNQLGLIISIIAFLPLVILIFTNKNMNGKQKGLVGAIAVGALVIAGIFGVDLNPPSLEQYQEQTEEVESLNNGQNQVYWTKSGRSYHLFQDCSYINSARTTEIFEGTVAQARELKNISDLCDRCRNTAKKEGQTAMPDEEVEVPEETEVAEPQE
jgi:hypothetical protein